MASLHSVTERKGKRCQKCNQELSHSAYTRHKNPAVCSEKRSEIQESVSDCARKNTLLETNGSEPTVLDELVTINLESQSMDITEYFTTSTSILEQETEIDSGGDVENSELSSTSEIGENSTSASENESTFYSSDDEKEIADTEESDQDVSDQLPLKKSDTEVDKEKVYICMFLSFFNCVIVYLNKEYHINYL